VEVATPKTSFGISTCFQYKILQKKYKEKLKKLKQLVKGTTLFLSEERQMLLENVN